MKWFRRKRDADEERLAAEIYAAQEQLARAEAAQPAVRELKEEMESHISKNRFGDRLFEEMLRTRKRRPA